MVIKKLIQSIFCIALLASSIVGAQSAQSEKDKLCDSCSRAKYWSVKMDRATSDEELEKSYKKYAQSKVACDAKIEALIDTKQNREFKIVGAALGGLVVLIGGILYFLPE